jgi:tetratricopeptide (TPR) repeat protein
MDIYCTVEERYIQAVEELHYGEAAKALKLFNELLAADDAYGRTYYQLGNINHYYIKDYRTAGYYYTKCIELDHRFPDVYEDFLKLLVFLDMEVKAKRLAEDALEVAGVSKTAIYRQLALLNEKNLNLLSALDYYSKGLELAIEKEDTENLKESVDRVKTKMRKNAKFVYNQ